MSIGHYADLRLQIRAAAATGSAPTADDANFLQKLGRVFKEKATSDLDRVFNGFSKSREKLSGVDEVVSLWTLQNSKGSLEDLTDLLMAADFGAGTASKLIEAVEQSILEGKVKDAAGLRAELKRGMIAMLTPAGAAQGLQLGDAKPGVILVVGVNGGGKTTTIGKLAHMFQREGAQVLLGAGDTFRAAAVEQLQGWADRSGATMHGPSKEGQRPGNVLAEAVEQARATGADLVICDTSGRLGNNWKLMDELKACKKALEKRMPGAPHELLLVLDGTQGKNMEKQAQQFNDAVGLTGLIVTKLDGTAKGGAVVGVVDELGLPVKFIGVGETVEDLKPFDAAAFVNAILP